jgi:hypothetical protein
MRNGDERSEEPAHGKTGQQESSRPVVAREASAASAPDRLGGFESWLRRFFETRREQPCLRALGSMMKALLGLEQGVGGERA